MANEIGSVNFGLELGASDNGLLKTLKQVTNAMESLEKSVSTLSSKMEGGFSGAAKSANTLSKSTSAGMRSVQKSITPTISTLDRLQSKYADVSKSSQRIGDGAKNMKSVEQAMRSYTQKVDQGFQSTQQMSAATAALNRQFTKAQQENQKYERTMIAIQKSIGSAERQVATMTTRLQAMGDSEKPVNELTQALQRYKTEITNAAGDSQKTTAAQERFKNTINKVENSTKKGSESVHNYGQEFRNLADAAILTYGPLSGIASRITTFTRLAKNNSASIAAFTASVVAMGVSLKRAVEAGVEFERQMLGMGAMIRASGRDAEITVGQLNALAESIAEATLSGTNETRQAASLLTSYKNIAVDSFQSVLEAAQGASSIMGGSIVQITRQFARALEDPTQGLSGLTRVGITFSESQKEMIENLTRTGQTMQAQAIVMDRLRTFQELATAEAQGLAGAYDTLGERTLKMYEALSANADINDVLAEGVNALSGVVKLLTEDMSVIEPILDGMRILVSSLSGAMSILSDNFSLIAKIMSAVFIAVTAKAAATVLLFTGRVLATTLGMKGLIGSLAGAAVAFNTTTGAAARLTASMGALRISMGALLGAWPLLIAAAITAYGAFDRSTTSTYDYEQALYDLGIATEDTADKQDSLANTLSLSAKSMLDTQSAAVRALEAEYLNATQGIQGAVKGIQDAIQSELSIQSTEGGLLSSLGISQGVSEASLELQKLGKEFDDVIKEMSQGGRTVSVEVLQPFIERAEDLGLVFDENITSVTEYVSALQDMGKELDEAMQKFLTLQENVENFGSAIDPEALLRGASEEFQDYFVNIGDIAEREMFRTTAALMSVGDVAEQAVAPRFDSLREQIVSSARDGVISYDEMNSRLASLIIEQDRAVESLQNMGDEFERIQTQDFRDEIVDIGREIQILSATSDAAKNALERSFESQDSISELTEQMEAFRLAGVEATVAAIAFSNIPGINADAIKSYEDLEAAIEKSVEIVSRLRLADDNKEKSNKKSEKSLDSLVDKYQELNDVLAQQAALTSGGIEGVLNLQKLQEEEAAIRDIQEAISELSSSEMQKFIKEAGVVVKSGESVEDAMIRMTRETSAFQDQLKEQEEASKVVTEGFDDIVEAYEEAQIGLAALTKGTDFYNRALANLEVSRQVDEMTEAFNKLNPVDQAAKLAVLSEAFGIVGLTVENLPEKLTEALKGIDQINRDIEDQMKIAEAAEKEAARFEEAFKDGINNVADTFKNGLLDMENGFSSFADNLLGSFKTMLADLAYEAFLRPVVVGFQADAGNILSGKGGGFGQTISAAKSVWDTGSKAYSALGLGGASAGVSGLGMAGGLSNAAISSANAVASGGGGLLGGLGGFASSAMPWIGGGLMLDNLLGGGITKALSGLFGSDRKSYGQIGSQIGGDTNSGNGVYRYDRNDRSMGWAQDSALGTIGVTKKQKTDDDALISMVGSFVEIDNALAAVMTSAQLENTRTALDGWKSSKTKNIGGIVDERLSAMVDATNSTFREALSSLSGEDLVTGLIGGLQVENVGAKMASAVASSMSNQFTKALSGGNIEEATQEILNSANAVIVLGDSSKRLNLNFDKTSASALEAAGNIAEYTGGLDNLSSLQSSYYQTYFTEAERAANLQDDLTASLSSMGMELPKSLQGFRDLVEVQDLNTEAGQRNYATLLQLSSGFNQLIRSTQDAENAIEVVGEALATLAETVEPLTDDANNALGRLKDSINAQKELMQEQLDLRLSALESEKEAIQNSYQDLSKKISDQISVVSSSISSLENVAKSLSNAIRQTEIQSRENQRSVFEASQRFLLNQIGGSGISDTDSFTNALSSVTADNSNLFSSFADFSYAQMTSQNLLESLEDETLSQLSVEESTLKQLKEDSEKAELYYGRNLERIDKQIEEERYQFDQEVKRLDQIVQGYQDQINLLSGIDTSILSVANAVKLVEDAINKLEIGSDRYSDELRDKITTEIEKVQGTADSAGVDYWEDVISSGKGAMEDLQHQLDLRKKISDEIVKYQGEATKAGVNYWNDMIAAGKASIADLTYQLQQNSPSGSSQSSSSSGKTPRPFWDRVFSAQMSDIETQSMRNFQAFNSVGEATAFASLRGINIPQFKEGGIASGPMSGYPVEMHGTEAIIPMGNGVLPLEINWPDSLSNYSPISSDSSSSSSSDDIASLKDELIAMKEQGYELNEMTYQMLLYIIKMFKLEDKWDNLGLPTIPAEGI